MLGCDDISLVEEMIGQKVGVSASPGFTWGRSGNAPTGAYLSNDSVPSNVAGRKVPVSTGVITTIFIDSEELSTFDISVFKHPSPFTILATVSVVAAKGGTFPIALPPTVTNADILGTQVTSGSCKNPVVGIIIRGTL
jgi:hypothetical protein